MENLTQTIQDYLKVIYDLNEAGQPASTMALATRLKVKPASVTSMLQRLAAANPPLVIYHKHHGAVLSQAGQRAALEVIRHHRLLESYLVDHFGYAWDEVHEEACRLEHVISEKLEARIAAALGHPCRDPHGDPIPTAELVLPLEETRPLSTLRPPQRAVVQRVININAALLRHLENLGLIPGARLIVRDYTPFDQNLTVEVEGRPSEVIGQAVSAQVFVEVCE